MRLIDADELKKHKYHSDITHENAVSVAQIDWMPTVCDIEQIRDEYKTPCSLCRYIDDDSGLCDMCPAMPREREE